MCLSVYASCRPRYRSLPTACFQRGVVSLGKVTSIELNHKAREVIKKGEPAVAIKIECPSYETPKMIGRHFTEKDGIVSHITRQSIDVLKSTFRDDVSKDEWQTVVKVSG